MEPRNTLKETLELDYDLQDLAVLGGRIDADIAEYANEFNVSKEHVIRILSEIINPN